MLLGTNSRQYSSMFISSPFVTTSSALSSFCSLSSFSSLSLSLSLSQGWSRGEGLYCSGAAYLFSSFPARGFKFESLNSNHRFRVLEYKPLISKSLISIPLNPSHSFQAASFDPLFPWPRLLPAASSSYPYAN